MRAALTIQIVDRTMGGEPARVEVGLICAQLARLIDLEFEFEQCAPASAVRPPASGQSATKSGRQIAASAARVSSLAELPVDMGHFWVTTEITTPNTCLPGEGGGGGKGGGGGEGRRASRTCPPQKESCDASGRNQSGGSSSARHHWAESRVLRQTLGPTEPNDSR